MQAVHVDADRFSGSEPVEPVRVWIEDGQGSIARGLVDVLSEDGAFIRLTEAASLASGNDVAVRLGFDRGSPTVPAAARVLWIRSNGEAWECELAWTHSGPERARLASLIAAQG